MLQRRHIDGSHALVAGHEITGKDRVSGIGHDKDVKISLKGDKVHVKGPAGSLDLVKPKGINLLLSEEKIVIEI